MLLSELITQNLSRDIDRPITGLALDSRKVCPGDVFLALAGTQIHGEVYIEAALQKGASAVLKEATVPTIKMLNDNIPCISQPNLSQQVGDFAARFYGYSSSKMQIIGVTGTNGKTSITHAIAHLLNAYAPCGLLGTLGYGTYGDLQLGLHTTPDAIQLQALLAQLQQQNVATVVMEVSSHALVQRRVNGITFNTAVLTNLSRDHLDYHKTMAAYGDAKRQLFNWPKLKIAIINYDDDFGQSVLADLPVTVSPLTYSIHDQTADVYAQIRAYNAYGCELKIHTPWGQGHLHTPWFGSFNVSNVIAALTTLLSQGYLLSDILNQLANLPPVPGRMERFGIMPQPTIIIDYAHTPDALQKALLALADHFSQSSNLWCVFGCGGNRDHGKRRLMGEVAQRYADKIVLTDDNPRHESSQAIIEDILQGCPNPTAVIPDRKQAISYALQNAHEGDVILIAGKGHEGYQLVGEQRLMFSDREVVIKLLDIENS